MQEKEDDKNEFSMKTLDRLSAMMTLQTAEESQGFDRVKYGISDDLTINIATQFSLYDKNDDGCLEFSEFKTLCDASDYTLSDDEIKAAMNLLDKSGKGVIQFGEFCDWYLATKDGKDLMSLG